MGSVSSYETKSGKRYRVRYRKPDNSQTDRRGFRTRRAAELFLATVEVNKATGTYVDPTHSRVTVRALGPAWLETKKTSLKPSAFAPVEVAWRKRVEPRWGKTLVTDILHSDVKKWVGELKEEAGATVVIRTFGVLAAILDDAVLDRRIAVNPARGAKVGLPRKMPTRHVYLTHGQVEQLALASGPHRVLVLVLAYTGIRWAEAVGLRVENLDLGRSRLWVERNAVEVANVIHEGTPKSHKIRPVPLPRFLRDELARLIRGRTPTELVFPADGGGFRKRTRTSSGSKSWFKTAAREAGVPPLTLHDLRHTAASLAVQAGANVKVIQRMLGHASAAMTLDVYADLFEDDLDAVSQALDRARSSEVVGKMWAEPSTAD